MLKKITTILRSRPAIIAAALFAIYLLLGYFAVNPLAQRLLPWVAETQLASRLTVGAVRFDPLRLSVTVERLQFARADGAPLAGFARLHADLEAAGLLRWAWRLKEVRLDAPQLIFDIAPDGRLNWAELIAKLQEDEEPPSDRMVRLLIDRLQIAGGDIRYRDRARATPFNAVLQPLGLALDGLSTLPEDRGSYLLAATLPEQGGTLKWDGEVGLNPLVSSGSLELEGIKLAKLMQLAGQNGLPLAVEQGDIASRFSYRFALVQDDPQLMLSGVSVRLAGLSAGLAGAGPARIELARLDAALPHLSFAMPQGRPQLRFSGLGLKLDDVALRQGEATLFALPRAELKQLDFDLAARRMSAAELQLADGMLQANRNAQGQLDWQALLPAAGAQSPAPQASATDDAVPVAAPATADAVPAAAAAPFRFALGQITLSNWQLGYRDATFARPLDVRAAAVNLGLALSGAGDAVTVNQLVSQWGPLELRSAGQAVARASGLALRQGTLDLAQRTASLDEAVLAGLQTTVLQPAGQPLNWQTILAPAAAQPPAAQAPADAALPWSLVLKRIALEDTRVHVEDRSLRSPMALDLQNGLLELRDASLDFTRAVPLRARFDVRQGGRFEAAGKLSPGALAGELQLRLDQLSLRPFAPYLNQAALLTLKEGRASARGRLALKSAQALTFRGGFQVDQLKIDEEASGDTFLSWKTLGSNDVVLGLAPNRLQMGELRVLEAAGKFIIHEDGSMNASRLLRQDAASERSPTQAAPAAAALQQGSAAAGTAPAFPVEVERIRVDNAKLEFADLSLTPQFGTHIHSLSGVINGLSSRADSTAQVELDGQVDEYGSARIRGAIQPFRATELTDLRLSFRNLEMNRLTPYSGKFAGRRIESGKLSVELEYKVNNRQLAGQNKFVINKLKLGERVESRDAMKLPLDLAIALLEDSNGVIDLDLPVSGSLDDPQFSYGRIVWKAVVNVLGKLVTAPFRALGSLLGLSADKLEAVMFDAGSARLAPPEQEKLQAVAQALAKRPALALQVQPAYDARADKAALQQAALRREVALRLGLTLAAGEAPGPVDLTNKKARRALEKLARERLAKADIKRLEDAAEAAAEPDQAFAAALLAALERNTPVAQAELQALAAARAGAVRDYLQQTGGLPAGRIALAEAVSSAGAAEEVKLTLSLTAGAGSVPAPPPPEAMPAAEAPAASAAAP